MKFLLFLGGIFVAVNAASLSTPELEEWTQYKIEYNKNYKSEEEDQYRRKIFEANKKKIEEHNTKYQRGDVTFEMGINQFSDLLEQEVKERFIEGTEEDKDGEWSEANFFDAPDDIELPDYVNWNERGAVTPVQNQGKCVSDYAFSAVGALEGLYYIQTGRLVALSAQNLVDCSRSAGNHGCQGGDAYRAYTYVGKNKGIDTQTYYPYTGVDTGKCRYNPKYAPVKCSGFEIISSGSEKKLKKVVALKGPVSAKMDANHPSFHNYKGGIYSEKNCSNLLSSLDHSVLVIGYGHDKYWDLDYWLVKNSWGEKWGETGFFRIARNCHNMCGIATDATIPIP